MQWWDHNGAVMLLYNEPEFTSGIILIQADLMNAYPKMVQPPGPPPTDGTTRPNIAVPCADAAECATGYWKPGDFLVHFAGFKGNMELFLQAFPPSTWVNYSSEYAAPLHRPIGRLVPG